MDKNFSKNGNEYENSSKLKESKEIFYFNQYKELEYYLIKDYDFKKKDVKEDDDLLIYIFKKNEMVIEIGIPNYNLYRKDVDQWGNQINESNEIVNYIKIRINNENQEIKFNLIKNSNYNSDYFPKVILDEDNNIYSFDNILCYRNFDIIIDSSDKKFNKDKYESLVEIVNEIIEKI